MDRDPGVCRAYRRRFLAIVIGVSLAGVLGPLLFFCAVASPSALGASGRDLDALAVIWFAASSGVLVASPIAAWHGARASVLARGRGGVVITAARPTRAVARMAVAAAALAAGWATPLVPSIWRSVSPGWWTWQDVLYILLVPILSALTLVLFVHFCGVCNVAARAVAVVRFSAADTPSDVSPYRFPMAPREVVVVTEHGARTLALVARPGGEIELASPGADASRAGPVEAWLVARALLGEA